MILSPSFLKGVYYAPPSKSYFQRALLGAFLAKGTSQIVNPGNSQDDNHLREALEKLGAVIEIAENSILLTGGSEIRTHSIDVGESGLASRLLLPILATGKETITLHGKGSLAKRPMDIGQDAIQKLGGFCELKDGKLPAQIKGPILGGNITLDGSISSQFLSGLLFALPLAKQNSILKVMDLKSKPYVDLTLDILKQFGIHISHDRYQLFNIQGQQTYQPATLTTEGDWSNAAFFMVGAAIHGDLQIKGLNPEGMQADKKILKALQSANADVQYKNNFFHIQSRDKLKAFSFDATDCPDLFPPLAVLAAHCHGTSKIKGTNRLIHKESNRARALKNEMTNMGIRTTLTQQDTMEITGGIVKGGTFSSHHDHRIAMAGAILALKAQKPIQIDNPEAVNKSYPAFFEEFEKLTQKKK